MELKQVCLHFVFNESATLPSVSPSLLSLAGLVREKHPTLPLVTAADRDLNGDGQRKAKHAAAACNATVALPPVFGDGTTP
ncbi:hypothetical protein [Pantoea ananatis]|uniref:hypothetical protein n=1 Tax=Pantoea ananas TaxID=553 RepID=UPI0021F72A87|nr:hypothetical protein [Pantoea ananatis]MCW0349209.1 hypothetical protein [Pantoea ananatis]